MPPIPHKPFEYPRLKDELCALGKERIRMFCMINRITEPRVEIRGSTGLTACAYYRKDKIVIGIKDCAFPCTETQVRNWNWPASVTDREPFGVLAHELGHHCDMLVGDAKDEYNSEWSTAVMKESGEPPITSYCPNPSEWFAECFRLFCTNPDLLARIRPKAYYIIVKRFQPIGNQNWIEQLGSNVPPKIIRTLKNKGA